jgi:WG containing repeat
MQVLKMIKLSVLFAVKTFPAIDDDYYDDAKPNIAGLAEWFMTIPDLFLLLLGDDAKAAPFAAYAEPGVNKALATETKKAMQRWQHYVELASVHAPDLIATLQPIDALLQEVKYDFLALDIFNAVSEKEQKPKNYAIFVDSLLKRAKDLTQALAQSDAKNCHTKIREMFNMPQQAHGYWSAEVLMRSGAIDREDIANIACLADYEENGIYWLYHIPAYIVRKKGSAKESPIAVITPYGRTLVPMSLGMNQLVDVYNKQMNSCDGWICCNAIEQTEDGKYTRFDSVLFDINGIQFSPILKNTELIVNSAKVGTLYKNAVALSDSSKKVLLADLKLTNGKAAVKVKNILESDTKQQYSEDGFIHFTKSRSIFYDNEQQDLDFAGLMSAEGEIIVPADQYATIGEMHKTKKIAAVSKYRPDYVYNENANSTDAENLGFLFGVINAKGEEIVPCKFAYLLPLNRGYHLKVHQKNRLLLMGFDKKLSIYTADGKLVAATHYQIPGNLVYYGTSYLLDNLITVTDGENVVQMDFDGVVGEPIASLTDFMDEILRPYREQSESMRTAKKQKYKTISAAKINKEDRWGELELLCFCVCLGDDNEAKQIVESIKTHIVSEDYVEKYWSIPANLPALHVAVKLALFDALESGFGARIDWKDSDTLGALASMLPKVAALKGFKWDAADNADSMQEGIAAAAKHVQKSKVNLFTLPADGDMYEIGFVKDEDMQTLKELSNSVGITLNFDW